LFYRIEHSDIKKLTWKDVIIENDTYFVKGIIQKTKKPFKIPLNSDALKIMGERKGDDDRVVTGLVYSGYKNNLIKQWGYKAGLKKDIHPHVGRHTFATQFTSQTKDMLSLQHIMGHKDIRTTQVYAKLVETDVQESMDKMDTLL